MASPTVAESRRAADLRAELDRIRSVLRGCASVKQVIVFGSVAAGHTREASDLDLVVVQETDEPFVDRAVRLAQLVTPRVGTQFLVYTPDELRALASRTFVQVEIRRKGKVLPMSPREDARRWLEFAEQDLRVAELALGGGIYNQVCFHAQQCVEKCLKACLAAEGEILPRTHLIVDLMNALAPSSRTGLEDLAERLVALDQFYIPTRCPDALPGSLPEGLPRRSHAEVTLETARRCYEHISKQLAPPS